nr:hypothetical protein [Tanacetum cinerariifolium]
MLSENVRRCLLRAVNVTKLGFRDSASSVVVCFFRGLCLLPRSFASPRRFLLRGHNQTIHERPVGKIGVYSRFFEYANFRLPLSTFLVDVLRDPFPKPTEFNGDDYAVLVSHPAPFRKFPEPFLFLVGMSRCYTLDENTYTGFLHDNEERRELAEGETKLLDSTVGRVVSLLPVAPDNSEGELEASVNRLLDEGGSTDQGDSAAGGGHDAMIEPVPDIAENVTADRPKCQSKKRPAVTDAGGYSHPSKKLRGDHGTSTVVTLPLITSFISATPEREDDNPTDSVTELNLCTICSAERFSSDFSHHYSTNASGAEVDSMIRSAILHPVMTEAVITSHAVSAPSLSVPETKTKITSPVHPFVFKDSGSTETVRLDVVGSSYYAKQDLSIGSRDERKRLESECKKQADLLKARDGEIRDLKAHLLLKEAEAAEAKNAALKKDKDAIDTRVAEFQSFVVDKERELKDLNVMVSSLKS